MMISTTSNAYHLDSSYAQFARNTLSELYPKKLIALKTFSELDELLIDLCQKAEAEYKTYMHPHIVSNLQISNPKLFATHHNSGIEIANNSIINDLNSRFDNEIN